MAQEQASHRGSAVPLGPARALALAVALAVASHPAAAQAPATGDLVTLDALHQQWVQDTLWCGQGDVRASYQDITIRCDEIEVDLPTMRLHAEGNVVLDQGQSRLTCSRMDFDLRAKVGTFYDVDAFFPPVYHFRGQEMQKLDEDHYRFHRGVFTSCDLASKAPPWSIDVRDALVQLEGYGHFRDAELKVRGVPIFYTPRLLWPVKRDRTAGLLVPSFGYSSQRGAYIGNAFFWPVSRSFDTTFYLDLYTKNYFGLGNEMRWAPADQGYGELAEAFIWDRATQRWQWKAAGKYNQLFPSGYVLHAELQQLSDLDFFQRFEGSTNTATGNRTLHSFLNLVRTLGPQAITFRTDWQHTFFTDPSSNSVTSSIELDRLAEIEYRLRSTRLGSTALYVSANGLLDELKVDRSPTLRGRYERFDFYPTLSLLTPGLAWLNVTPTVGARETYYTAQYSPDHQSLVDAPISRHYGTAGLSLVGPSFSRVWTLEGGDKLKHLIEPRIDYTYVSNPGGSLANPSTSTIPLFDERDTVLVTNQVKWTFGNHLLYKSGPAGSREVAGLEISQVYSLSDPLTAARLVYDPSAGKMAALPPSQKLPLDIWLRVSPLPTATLDSRFDFDPVTHKLSSTSVTGGYTSGPTGINLTWFSGFSPTGQALSSQTRLFLALGPATAPWRLESMIAYDIHNKNLLDERYVFRWRGSCWSAQFQYHDYRIAPYQTKDYRVQIDLTGLGTFLDIKGALDSLSH